MAAPIPAHLAALADAWQPTPAQLDHLLERIGAATPEAKARQEGRLAVTEGKPQAANPFAPGSAAAAAWAQGYAEAAAEVFDAEYQTDR